jgi:hypothetical protein
MEYVNITLCKTHFFSVFLSGKNFRHEELALGQGEIQMPLTYPALVNSHFIQNCEYIV